MIALHNQKNISKSQETKKKMLNKKKEVQILLTKVTKFWMKPIILIKEKSIKKITQ